MTPAQADQAAPKISQTRRRVVVLGGNRIPFARSDGAYAEASNQDMFIAALDGLVERFGLVGERLGMVVGGAVLKHSPLAQGLAFEEVARLARGARGKDPEGQRAEFIQLVDDAAALSK